MYIDAISTLGAHKPSSVGKPLRNLETITSACDLGRYSVMIAAIFFLLVSIFLLDRRQRSKQRLDVPHRVRQSPRQCPLVSF